MKSPRSAEFLRTVARRLLTWADAIGPDATTQALDAAYRPHPMTLEAGAMKREQDESLRRELEAEARAEFGLRNVEFVPDPASPGDVWPPESRVTPLTRKLRGVR